jgi:hypothetical protein
MKDPSVLFCLFASLLLIITYIDFSQLKFIKKEDGKEIDTILALREELKTCKESSIRKELKIYKELYKLAITNYTILDLKLKELGNSDKKLCFGRNLRYKDSSDGLMLFEIGRDGLVYEKCSKRRSNSYDWPCYFEEELEEDPYYIDNSCYVLNEGVGYEKEFYRDSDMKIAKIGDCVNWVFEGCCDRLK